MKSVFRELAALTRAEDLAHAATNLESRLVSLEWFQQSECVRAAAAGVAVEQQFLGNVGVSQR